MGVINRSEPNYTHVQSSSSDTLQIPEPISEQTSVSSVLINIPFVQTRRQRRRRAAIDNELSASNAGRRRQRRMTAENELLSALVNKEEPKGMPHKSAFAIIMSNPAYHGILEDFINDDTNKQEKMIEQIVLKSAKPRRTTISSYANVSNNIKLQLKTMRNEYQLEMIENEIIEFFSKSACGSYINNHLSSYQRLLVHGIAQYYGLKSTSFDAEDGKRVVKVQNPKNYSFGDKRLYRIVQENHSKR